MSTQDKPPTAADELEDLLADVDDEEDPREAAKSKGRPEAAAKDDKQAGTKLAGPGETDALLNALLDEPQASEVSASSKSAATG